jgi:DNA-binding transcriptional MerR regulator
VTASPEPRRPGSGREVTRSIGQVLTALSGEFPDISISKIRFLESEGLITPQRAPSGYRRYAEHDVERLRYVLSVQREHYLPLKVIREHLEMMDRGQTPPEPKTLEAGSTSASTSTGTAAVAPTPATPPTAPKKALRLSRQDLLEASGLSEAGLVELERTGIVVPRRGGSFYGRDALTLAIAARRLGEYGIDGRHLRAFKMSADREVGLVEQAIAPYVRRAGGNTDVSGEVTQLVISFHAALVRTAMER